MNRPETIFAREVSPYFAQQVERHPRWLELLEEQGRLDDDSPPGSVALAEVIERHGLDRGLRRFRYREMLRIIWREVNRRGQVAGTLMDLSRLAELCLQASLDSHWDVQTKRYGAPFGPNGEPQRLLVLGLGKLGGRELNLSSDIDLIFCYPGSGECTGPRALSSEQFFTRLVRAMIKSLAEITEDGFCFRVDTRLRPFGEAGPLVCSLGALEQYYQREGRNWERYALLKARPVAGDLPMGLDLLKSLKPFIYRRYIDYGAVESLREMLDAIRADAARRGREHDVKRGRGGIREIEFLVQCMQLLRGGREPVLQTQSLFTALKEFEALELLPRERIQQLREDYVFLRHVENAVQALHDQQTHSVPAGDDHLRVARANGFADSKAFDHALHWMKVFRVALAPMQQP
jgi:glutamate-ammonia-ligase adenylyltransferase